MKTILLIDNDKATRTLWAKVISRFKFNVLTAANDYEALDILKKETVNVVFIDFVLEETYGKEAYEKIKALYKDIKIYIITGTDTTTSMKAYSVKAHGYITKPIILDDLKALLKKIKEETVY